MIAGMALLLSSCGNDNGQQEASHVPTTSLRADPCPVDPANAAGFLSLDGLREGRACAIGLYTWPPGMAPDPHLVDTLTANFPGGQMSRFEYGMQYSSVFGIYRCAWIISWLEAHQAGDAAAAEVALDVMTNELPDPYDDFPFLPNPLFDESTRDIYLHLAETARLGDPRPTTEFLQEFQCYQYYPDR